MYWSTETSTVPRDRVHPLYNVLKRKDNRGDRKKGEEVEKGEWEAEIQHRAKQQKKGRMRLH